MRETVFSPADIAYLREHYATVPSTEIAKTLGKTPKQVRSKAYCLALVRKPEVTLTEILLAAAVKGYRNKEIEWPQRATVHNMTTRLTLAGKLFAATPVQGVRGKVFFDTAEKAQAHERAFAPGPKRKRGRQPGAPQLRRGTALTPKPTPRAGWGPDDPVHITAETRITIAPTPQRALRTNTHQVFG